MKRASWTPHQTAWGSGAGGDKFSSPCPSKCFYRQSFTASFCLVLKIALHAQALKGILRERNE